MREIWTIKKRVTSHMKVQMLYNVANRPSFLYVLLKMNVLKQVFLDFMCIFI